MAEQKCLILSIDIGFDDFTYYVIYHRESFNESRQLISTLLNHANAFILVKINLILSHSYYLK